MRALSELPPSVAWALASSEIAQQIQVDHLNLTPDFSLPSSAVWRMPAFPGCRARARSMSTLRPRVVTVTRPSEFDELVARHGTTAQAEFFLTSRGRTLDEVRHRHETLREAITATSKAILRIGAGPRW